MARGRHPTETDQLSGDISLMTSLTGNPSEKPTVKTQAHCVRAACSVTLWSPVQLGNSESYEASSFSVKVRAVRLLNTLVLDLGLVEVFQSQELFFLYCTSDR